MNEDFTVLVKKELIKSRTQYRPMTTFHEAAGVLREEFEEFWDEVKKKDCNINLMLAELVQVGAMAQAAAEDLLLIKRSVDQPTRDQQLDIIDQCNSKE